MRSLNISFSPNAIFSYSAMLLLCYLCFLRDSLAHFLFLSSRYSWLGKTDLIEIKSWTEMEARSIANWHILNVSVQTFLSVLEPHLNSCSSTFMDGSLANYCCRFLAIRVTNCSLRSIGSPMNETPFGKLVRSILSFFPFLILRFLFDNRLLQRLRYEKFGLEPQGLVYWKFWTYKEE